MVDRVVLTQHPRPVANRTNGRQHGGLWPVLLEWRGIRIYSYPTMIYLGLTFGVIAGNHVAKFAGMNATRFFVAIMLLAVAGMIGARLLFVATHWGIYRREPARIWRRSEGGAAVLGGLILAVAVSPAVLAPLELPFGAFWDVATFVMLIWSIFGRVGCLLHGCCSGRPSEGPLAFDLPDHHGIWRRRIPTQLLEAGVGVLLLIGATTLWGALPIPGALFLAAVAAYGIGRAVLQPLRDDQERIGTLNIHQALALGASVISLCVLLLLWLRHHQGL